MSNGTAAYTGRTAWARNLASPVRDFLSTETGSAAVLLGAVVAALVWANSPWPDSYESVWTTTLSVHVGGAGIEQDLRHWVNNGLMALFFLVVGLEAKREIDTGELRERQRIAIPVMAAAGGIVVPIAIYLAINSGGHAAHGFGAAMSTDTAFALGVLALIAPGGTRLRVFMLTLAVADDLVALSVIAVAYTDRIDWVPLLVAVALFCLAYPLRYAPIEWRRQAALLLGLAVWVAVYESGIDPIVAGLAVGLIMSAYPPSRSELERVTEQARSFREQPTPELARVARLSVASAVSPNERIQYALHPWVSYLIVPLFALANSGIHMRSGLVGDAISSPITIGIVVAYVVGKPLGVAGATWLGTRRVFGGMRLALSWPVVALGGVVAGVGFTVSLLISTLAFHGRELDEARIGTLSAAVLAAAAGWIVTRLIARVPAPVRARQIAGTADDLLDLSDDVDPERDHIRGSDDALVTLVEYGDYECPYCGEAERVIRELLESFGGELRYVWRHLPLNDVHPHTQMAAEAAEAAAAQGRFWEMHDKLHEDSEHLEPSDLGERAEQLGLDVDRFWDELRRREYAERVAEDVASADTSGVAGTPSFFINGRRHRGAYDAATLTDAVRSAAGRARLARKAEQALVSS
jgi:Na+/H+ antiporter NhaA